MMWAIKISSKQNLSDADRDFIAELISEEPRSVISSHGFILHDIIESKKYCEALIGGSRTAIAGLLSTLKNSVPYKINYE